MNRAAKGRRCEYKSIQLLRDEGFEVIRAAASKGVFDLVGIGAAGLALIQVKANAWPGRAEVERMRAFPVPPGARRLIHRWDDGEREPRIKEL
ncbi:MAG: hypothetical protein FJW36_24650 [Acidobacteria bacterium]|nr:hypothetical protein [Acidobacteriota bacterium]